jgi:hypothetical protein
VPAAAVIPAPLAYIKVVAVKKLVVEFWTGSCRAQPSRPPRGLRSRAAGRSSNREPVVSSLNRVRSGSVYDVNLRILHCNDMFTLRKLECSEQAVGM